MKTVILANPGFVKEFAAKFNYEDKGVLDSNIIAACGSILPAGRFLAQIALPVMAVPTGRNVSLYTCWLLLAARILAESLSRCWNIGWSPKC